VIIVLWIGFAASWILAAAWSDKTAKSVGIRDEIGYRALQLLGWILLAVPAHGYVGPLRPWQVTWAEAWVCVALIALGLAFSWWARIYLGPLWSSQVTRKINHRIVAAALLITLAFWLKARLEERWLSEELGPDEYQAYRRRVPMLLPFGPRA
jgi:protein-S-isoprenylcysteine O-methyltransferase Ste14